MENAADEPVQAHGACIHKLRARMEPMRAKSRRLAKKALEVLADFTYRRGMSGREALQSERTPPR